MRFSVIRNICFVLFVCVVAGDALCQTCLPAPTPLSPSNNATGISTTPTFSWSAVSGATDYDIQWGTDQTCSTGTLATSGSTSFNPPALSAGTTYGWKVRAKNVNCQNAAYSSCFKFTTVACNAPGSFDLRSPNNITTGATPQLSWNAASGAAKYLVRIGTSNPPQPSANDPLISGTSYTPTQPLSPGTYFWYVDAYPSCSSQLSTRSASTFTFTVRTCPTGSASLTSPANGASLTSTSITFNWTTVVSALSYDLMLSNDGGANFTNAGNATTSSLTKTLPLGSYVWYVRTNFDATCASTNSQASRFTITQSNCPTATPTLISPANGATNVTLPVTLTWNGVAGATGYKIFGAANGSITLVGSTTDATRFVTSSVPSGTVAWWVRR